ncbi:hypothetical protein D3C71_2246990 [compost metagenome]
MFRTYLLLQWFCAAEAFDFGNRHVAEPGAFEADGAGDMRRQEHVRKAVKGRIR